MVDEQEREMIRELGDSARFLTVTDRAFAWLRRDWLPILLYLLATLVMTYPLVLRLRGNLMPLTGDMYMKLWDVWWLDHLIQTGQNIFRSQELFYPVGLDLSYHPTSWTATALTWLLSQRISIFSAYKITILFAVFTSAYAAYLLILWLTKHPIAAWFGGAIYAFAPYHFGDLRDHPDLSQLAPIPITLLFFLQALSTGNVFLATAAGLMLGVVAWTGLYLFGFTVITLALLFLYLAIAGRRWRKKRFWLAIVVFTLASLIPLFPRLYPVFKNIDTLSYVIDNKFLADSRQADLLAYVIPPGANPLFTPLTGDLSASFAKSESRHPSPYLGLIGIAATLSALTWRKHRSEVWAWSAIAALFILLSIGPILRYSGQVYEDIRLPGSVLMNFDLFRSVRPNLFHIGFLLPFAVLSSYGISRWLTRLPSHPKARKVVVILLALIMLAEYWVGQFPLEPLIVSPIYDQFASDKDEYALIDLPMGYTESKRYLYLQSIHGRPIIEGMSSRMPPDAFEYINANPLLARWQALNEHDCDEFTDDDYVLAIDALIADGFRYVVLHSHNKILRDYLEATPKEYDDDILSAYTLADLRGNPPCAIN